MSLSSYDKIQSVDWNGQYFILTARSEATDGSFSYVYSADGQTWAPVKFGFDISNGNPYATKWLGDKFIVAGNIVSSSQTCLINVVEGAYPTIIKTNMATDTIVYDIEKNIEMPNRIVFSRTVILALGPQVSMSVNQGESWTQVSTDLSFCSDAVWNGHHWVAVGQGTEGTVVTSLDGVRWLNRGNYVFSNSCNGIDWSPQQNKYVAVGEGTYIVGTSSDGIYWRGLNTNLFSVGNDVKWNGSIWVSTGLAVGTGPANNTIAYSADGESWTYAETGFSGQGLRVYWDGAVWTAFGLDNSYNIATSADGVHWNLSYIQNASALSLGFSEPIIPDASLNLYVDIPFALKSPGFAVKKYVHNHSDKGTVIIQPISVACGYGQCTLAYSVDGIQWSAANNALFTQCNKACWNGQIWVAVGVGTYCMATSPDGIAWTGANSTIFTEAYDVAWNGQMWIATGEGSTRIAYSSDGFTWFPVSESVFSTRVHAIEWTGRVWLAYGSGPGSATSADGITWTAKSLCLTDCSNLTLNGSTYTSSSSQISYPATNANDGMTTSFWSSATSLYDASGNYLGSETTAYNSSSQTASGEWLQIQLSGQAICRNYFVVGSNAASFLLLGSTDGSAWVLLDSVVSSALIKILPLNIQNATAYSYYRFVFTKTAGSDYTRVGEVALFDGGAEQLLDRYIRPIVLKNYVLHPTRVFSIDGSFNNIYRVSDLSCNLLHNGSVMAGSETTASTFDGEYHVVFGKNGEVGYLSNSASLTNLEFDSSLNGISLNTGLSNIRAACYNRRFILIGGAGGAAYGVFKHNAPPAFYNTSLSSLLTNIQCLASNSGYGHTVCNNTIHLQENERLTMTTPKYNNNGSSCASVSFNVYKT